MKETFSLFKQFEVVMGKDVNGLISLIKIESFMIAKEYCIAFFEGYFYAQLGERLNDGKVTEHTLDLAKETAQTFIEQQIAYSGFEEKQKLVMKENLHEWADKAMQGFKKRLRESGRLIES